MVKRAVNQGVYFLSNESGALVGGDGQPCNMPGGQQEIVVSQGVGGPRPWALKSRPRTWVLRPHARWGQTR
eukprot:6898682-Lingulodinium_polyedra.AAC.1